MTKVINAENVNDAFLKGLWWLHNSGIESTSRNGRVLVSSTPVITEYSRPNERVLFGALRDANPFFHLMEALWMLAGRNDVRFPTYYAANISSFSDDGTTISGAYGERWRTRFGYDQLSVIINELRANPDTRRCVLSMWQADNTDQPSDIWLAMNGGKDVPCNTHAYFDTLEGKLNMTVLCRSNDVVWGCYGANAVHFSVLHEYVALSCGVEQGVYRQFSNNYHLYSDRPDVSRLFRTDGRGPEHNASENRYEDDRMRPYPLINTDQATWDADMKVFFGEWAEGKQMDGQLYLDPFWSGVMVPLVNAHHFYKEKKFESAIIVAGRCIADDWCVAAKEWLQRRKDKA